MGDAPGGARGVVGQRRGTRGRRRLRASRLARARRAASGLTDAYVSVVRLKLKDCSESLNDCRARRAPREKGAKRAAAVASLGRDSRARTRDVWKATRGARRQSGRTARRPTFRCDGSTDCLRQPDHLRLRTGRFGRGDSRLCVPASRQVCPYRVQSIKRARAARASDPVSTLRNRARLCQRPF